MHERDHRRSLLPLEPVREPMRLRDAALLATACIISAAVMIYGGMALAVWIGGVL